MAFLGVPSSGASIASRTGGAGRRSRTPRRTSFVQRGDKMPKTPLEHAENFDLRDRH
jgi:hypothetical protein